MNKPATALYTQGVPLILATILRETSRSEQPKRTMIALKMMALPQ